jgi:acyl-CoA synthetase (AMP-forming)/AMP-acid ligase II
MMLPGEILRRNSRLFSKKIGLVDDRKQFSYGEINERVNRLGNALRELGLEQGDKIAIMAENCHQFVETYFAIAKAGLVVVPVNARFSAEEASYIINHSDSVAFIFQKQLTSILRNLWEMIPKVKHIISIGKGQQGVHSYEALLANSTDKEPEVEIHPDDTMMIMYTSGATGIPKGVITSHGNIMANTNTMTLETRIVPEDITLLVMPLYHNGGFWPTFSHFYRGATVILLSRFDAENVMKMVEKHRVTFLNLVPTMLMRIIHHPDISKYNLQTLRLIMYAGAPIALKQLQDAMEILGSHRFYSGLGSTEASGCMISFPTTEHTLVGPLSEKLASVGRDGIGIEIKIVDESGNDLPIGEAGEIIARGDNVAKGYWKMPEETSETFRNGWLYTGDIGYRDEDGYIFIVDRKKDIIISGGENVSSSEVEEVLYQHPSVAEAAVIGLPDDEWGEAVKAVISLRPKYNGKVTGEEIINFCKSRLAGFKRPKSVEILDALPKNAAGKITKQELRKRYREG